MHSGIYADAELRAVAMAVARNNVGARRLLQEIAANEGITSAEFDQISQNPQFKRYLEAYERDLRENTSFFGKIEGFGRGFVFLTPIFGQRQQYTPAVRVKMIENLVEWAELKPKKDQGQLAVGSGFSITINLPDSEQKEEKIVIQHEEIADSEPETPKLLENAAEIVLEEPKKGEKQPKLTLKTLFDEDDDYEYAGDDVLV